MIMIKSFTTHISKGSDKVVFSMKISDKNEWIKTEKLG